MHLYFHQAQGLIEARDNATRLIVSAGYNELQDRGRGSKGERRIRELSCAPRPVFARMNAF